MPVPSDGQREITDLSRRTHHLWKKGVSANPGGRPKELKEVSALARIESVDAIRTLVSIHKDTGVPASARIAAANAVLDRAFGKPKEQKDIEVNVHEHARQIAIEQLDDAQLDALNAAFEALIPVERQIIEAEAREIEDLSPANRNGGED